MKAGLTMTDEKHTIPMTIIEASDPKAAKWYQKRMYQLAAVTSVVSLLVIIAVVTGFVVMAKEHEKTNRRIIERTIPMPNGDGMHDKRESIIDENIEVDTLTTPDGLQQVIVFDYNRRLQIKLQDDQCIVSAMFETKKKNQALMLVVDTKPVKDDSFLSVTTRGMCKGKYIHWAHPGCIPEMEHEEGSHRTKREDELMTSSFGLDIVNAGGEGYLADTYCPTGVTNCCAWCSEGVVTGGYWFLIETFGISSQGAYGIIPGSIIVDIGGDLYVGCIWYLLNSNGQDIYGCDIDGISDPELFALGR